MSAGATERVAIDGDGATLCLTDGQARVLAATGDRVERHFGRPQDIEWAFDAAGTLWLTQSRPITTLFPVPDRPAHAELERPGLRVYFCLSVAQGLYRPLTPMGLAGMRVLTSGAELLLSTRPPAGRRVPWWGWRHHPASRPGLPG